MSDLTKAVTALPTVSIRMERYVKLADVLALITAAEATPKPEADDADPEQPA